MSGIFGAISEKQINKSHIKLLSNQIKSRGCESSGIIYYNSCDVLIFPSKAEGSPNAVKEAMACNMPIVATDVGDVKWLFGKTKGLFISDFNTENIATNLKQAFAESSSNGRDQIKSLGLDAPTVAIKLISIYKSIIN